MKAQAEGWARDLLDGHYESRSQAVNFIGQQAVGELSKYASVVSTGQSKGLYFASAMNNVLFQESVVHEMAHAVQEHRWDFTKVIDFYFSRIKPLGSRQAPPAHIVKTHFQVNERLFKKKVGTKHTAFFFQKWQERNPTEFDFVLFNNLVTLLAEVDAHTQQGWMAEEYGYNLPIFSSQLFRHLRASYVGASAPIHPLVFDLAIAEGPEPILELVRTLNASFRPQF